MFGSPEQPSRSYEAVCQVYRDELAKGGSHPLLGKLTIREMLYFTIYHNLRHASQTGD